MTFKDYLPADNHMMMNVEEFGEEIIIDDVELRAVAEESTAQKSGNRNLNYPGLHGDFLEIYFCVEDYIAERERLMKHGEVCHVNGKRYDVVQCTDEQGMCHLILSAYRQEQVRMNLARRLSAGEEEY